jgi:hypothetical protein
MERMPMSPLTLVVVIVLLLLLVGGLPHYQYSSTWGYGPSGAVGLVLIVLIVLMLLGRL